ncbi:unnamed protein product [Phytophthora lilii]|uniref:Unnamed protein product n=1 Tax=Phytophthora lilii TaxID=2077276 RepID=A0A9W7CS43_9STRA|nr:unnamed protein product [Phytophthora lilii]
MVFKGLSVSSTIPEAKLKRAFKTGTLSLSKDDLSGSGATLYIHPESYAKAVKAHKAGKGKRLAITKKEIGYPFKHMNGGGMYGSSIWSKVWGGIKSAFKLAKIRDYYLAQLISLFPLSLHMLANQLLPRESCNPFYDWNWCI